jgi:pimeloyl-ACP methyl ester carboxylesterase
VICLYKIINKININYEDYGTSPKTIVFLHGWGQNINMMKPLSNLLAKTYRVIVIDLPGFGGSDEPKEIMTVYDYAKVINELLLSLKVSDPILVGHSFGGKIALVYASIYNTSKLVVMGSPYDIEVKKISLKVKILKTLKKVPGLNMFENFFKQRIGSPDYRSASVMMRSILTDTVNRSIISELKNIKCPTLIIWGTEDEAVSISFAYELEKLIPNAGLVIYEGCTHYAYLERLEQTAKVLKTFVKGDE